jgi:hypothetical protein
MENPKKRKQLASSSNDKDEAKPDAAQRGPASAQKQPQQQRGPAKSSSTSSSSNPEAAAEEVVKRPRVSQPPTSSSKANPQSTQQQQQPQSSKKQQQQQQHKSSGKGKVDREEDNDDEDGSAEVDEDKEDEKQHERKSAPRAHTSASSSSSSFSASLGGSGFEEDDVSYDFASLEIADATKKAISEMGFTRMTEVQARCIPTLLVRCPRASHSSLRPVMLHSGSPFLMRYRSCVRWLGFFLLVRRKDATFLAPPRPAPAKRLRFSFRPSSCFCEPSSRRATVRPAAASSPGCVDSSLEVSFPTCLPLLLCLFLTFHRHWRDCDFSDARALPGDLRRGDRALQVPPLHARRRHGRHQSKGRGRPVRDPHESTNTSID